jgi:hypothetical protein
MTQRRGRAEYYESVLLADWLERVAKVCFTHIPNGENRDHRERIDKRSGRKVRWSPAGRKLQRMGLRPGVADYWILDTPPMLYGRKGAVVELKAKQADGGKRPTDEQMEFLNEAAKRGYASAWFYGADEAIEWLEKMCGYGRKS